MECDNDVAVNDKKMEIRTIYFNKVSLYYFELFCKIRDLIKPLKIECWMCTD